MNFIYTIFGYPLGWVMWLCYNVIKNYGVALIVFTIILRIVQFPLSIKQQKSSARMALFKPKMDALQKKYKNDKAKQQEEMIKLQQEEGYSPTAGCLPMLIQFPILFGVIDVVYKPLTHILRLPSDVINKAIEIAKSVGTVSAGAPQISVMKFLSQSPEKFSELGSDVIAKIQSVDLNFLGINLGDIPSFAFNLLLIIPVLAGITALFQTILMMKTNPLYSDSSTPGMGATKISMYIMPIFSVWIAFTVPAGVGLYWSISNILMAVQSVLLFKLYHPDKLRKQMEEEQAKRKADVKKYVKQVEITDKTGKKKTLDKELSEKEINRIRLARARELDAEQYGEQYSDVTDDDLKS